MTADLHHIFPGIRFWSAVQADNDFINQHIAVMDKAHMQGMALLLVKVLRRERGGWRYQNSGCRLAGSHRWHPRRVEWQAPQSYHPSPSIFASANLSVFHTSGHPAPTKCCSERDPEGSYAYALSITGNTSSKSSMIKSGWAVSNCWRVCAPVVIPMLKRQPAF